jgi:hypothetical protein
MRKEIVLAISILTVCVVSVFGAGSTPIQGLKLIGDANGNGSSFTNLNSVAASNVVVESNLTVRGSMHVSAWDDMLASANTAYRSGASDISTDDALGGQAFAVTATTNAANDHLTFVYQTPHRAKVGGELHPHVHFWQTNADQTNCWYMYYSVSAIGTTNRSEVFVGPASNVVTYTGGTFHQLAVFPTFTNPGISSKIRIKLHRHGSVGTGAITATDFDLHYEVDGFGSDDIASKSY